MSSLCLPDSWLRHFSDPLLVIVLAAYRDAQQVTSGFISFSERECVARTRLDRKTVRQKKRELVALRVFLPLAAKRGQVGQVRIDWERLHELVENPVEVGEIGTTATDRVGEIGTTPAVNWSEKGPLAEREVGEKHPAFSDKWGKFGPPVGEIGTTPGGASLGLIASSSELASSQEKQPPEENQLDDAIVDAIERSRLTHVGGKPLDAPTVVNLRKALLELPSLAERKDALEHLEEKCRQLAKHPQQARSWGLIVKAMQECQRKPPAQERFGYTELRAQLAAAANSKSLR